MPAWAPKDEREFARVKQSVEQQGASERLAAEIAANTVNKHHVNSSEALEDRSLAELRNVATGMGIRGRSKMNKAQLMRAIRENR